MIKIISLDTAVEKGFFINKETSRIILAGAGISSAGPANLPLGKELTDFYLQTSIGSKAAEYVLEKWDCFSKLIYHDTGRNFPNLRLEMIVDNVNKMERRMEIQGMINGFNGFTKCPSNYNHRLLYQLAKKGNMILTPNFDTAIENAYGEIRNFNREYELQCPILRNGEGLRIYHFHGIPNFNSEMYYSDEFALGATIENIKEGVPKGLGNNLIEKIQRGWQIVFLGYSGSDFFDITPFFANLPNINTGTAICFAHRQKPSGEELYRYKQLLSKFENAYILYGDTTQFLELILGVELCQTKHIMEQSNNFDWKKEFRNIRGEYTEEQHEIVLIENGIRILNQIDLNYYECYSGWARALKKLLTYLLSNNHSSTFFSEPDLSSTIVADLKEVCTNGIKLYPERSCLFRQEYEAMYTIMDGKRKSIISPADMAEQTSFERLLNIVNKGEINAENYNSRTVYTMNNHVKSCIRMWIQEPDNINIRSRLLQLSEALDRMLTMPYYQYMYLSYYITLLKLKNLVKAILIPDDENIELEKRMLEMAMEINCTSQVEKVYKNWTRKQLLLNQITHKKGNIEKAEHNYDMMKKIARICGRKEMCSFQFDLI